ncbi:MAG: signal peptidase I [Oscillospiraceae bacterium]|nr:signal peptidase I [Oscillospiraceae bacterium]
MNNIKTLEELNREFLSDNVSNEPENGLDGPGAPQPQKKRGGIFAAISDTLFFAAVLALVVSNIAMAFSKDGEPAMFMGYAYFTVLSPSMAPEIPEDSLIIIKKTEPQKLEVGDNITFVRDLGDPITHKIEGIYENYQNSGGRAYQTKGINNAAPDEWLVPEARVWGKVVLVLPILGKALSYLLLHSYIIYVFFGICIIFYLVFRFLPNRV